MKKTSYAMLIFIAGPVVMALYIFVLHLLSDLFGVAPVLASVFLVFWLTFVIGVAKTSNFD